MSTDIWTYKGKVVEQEDAEGYQGFVYLITNNLNQRKYVGKKFFWKPKTRTVKGKKKKEIVPSDWKDYFGSNKHLQEDVEKHGAENFTREILHFCLNKGTCTYMELKEQMDRDVLIKEEYYNGFIGGKINARSVKFED